MTRVTDDQIVHVAIEDGFEIPYAAKDLLKAEGGDSPEPPTGRPSRPGQAAGTDRLFSTPNKIGERPEGVYLALAPTDQENLLGGRLEVMLLNHTPCQLLYALFLNRSGQYHGTAAGQLAPDSSQLMARIERNGVEDWANGLAQFVFYRDGKTNTLRPASETIRFKPIRVYKEESFPYDTLLRRKAMLVELTTLERLEQAETKTDEQGTDPKEGHEKAREGTRREEAKPEKERFLDKHMVDDRIAEVDLHIGELTDHFTNLSNADMLGIQMDYFRQCMEHARRDRLSRIIFIHGVGNGTLKNELLRSLRQTEGIEFHDASFARYGLGATEVVFRKH